ncbi:hypothetical protein [Lentzea roselyniae]|uniref:hypothetical protein n=1 Tax=Lentzea roselyniae TaxID=531940 RepID=UPI0031F807EE
MKTPASCEVTVFGKYGWLIDNAPRALSTPTPATTAASTMPTTSVAPDIRKLMITNAAMTSIPTARIQFRIARSTSGAGFGGR